MNGRVVFLLEEESMEALLRGFLERFRPGWRENVDWIPVPHRGKSHLEESIPRKLKAWREPGVRFVILRDNDGGDCRKLKAHLQALAATAKAEAEVLIRIVCQQMESWLLGDLEAVRAAYSRIPVRQGTLPAKYRQPDDLTNASQEIQTLTGDPRKVARTEAIAPHLRPECNRSRSFQAFLTGLERLIAAR